jgi:hypothetical protein
MISPRTNTERRYAFSGPRTAMNIPTSSTPASLLRTDTLAGLSRTSAELTIDMAEDDQDMAENEQDMAEDDQDMAEDEQDMADTLAGLSRTLAVLRIHFDENDQDMTEDEDMADYTKYMAAQSMADMAAHYTATEGAVLRSGARWRFWWHCIARCACFQRRRK